MTSTGSSRRTGPSLAADSGRSATAPESPGRPPTLRTASYRSTPQQHGTPDGHDTGVPARHRDYAPAPRTAPDAASRSTAERRPPYRRVHNPRVHGAHRGPAATARCPRRRGRSLVLLPWVTGFALVALGIAVIALWQPWAGPARDSLGASAQTDDVRYPGEAPGQAAELGTIDSTTSFDQALFPLSTPRERWQQGQMPYLFQKDVAWRDQPYAGGTVGDNACGPTCMDMVYIFLTGDASYTPADLATLADAGNFAPTGATEWSYMTAGAAQLGIAGTPINPYYREVTAALEAGMPVIASMVPGEFTDVGHYIVLSGIDEYGMVSIHDPNSVLNSAQKWGLARVLRQANMCWAFSR